MGRREEILRTAVQIATVEGIGALTVRRVAAEAGIGPTTLRHYFPAQADLCVAVVGELSDGNLSDGDIDDTSRPALDRLADRLEQFLLVDEARRAGFDVWLRLREMPSAGEGFDVFMRSAYQLTAEAMTRWLTRLADEGHVQPADVEPAAFTVTAFLDGLAMRHLNGVEDDLDETRRRLRWLLARFVH